MSAFGFLRQPAPQQIACHACGHHFAGAICPLCKEERPAYTAMKRIADACKALGEQPVPQSLPPCRYAPKALCNCGGRGLCLPTA